MSMGDPRGSPPRVWDWESKQLNAVTTISKQVVSASDLTSLGLGALSFMDVVKGLPLTPHQGHGMSWEPGKEAQKVPSTERAPASDLASHSVGDLPWARSCAGCSPSHQAWERGCRVASMPLGPQGAREGRQVRSEEASEVLSSEGGRCRGPGVRGHCVRCQDAGRSVGPEACSVGN